MKNTDLFYKFKELDKTERLKELLYEAHGLMGELYLDKEYKPLTPNEVNKIAFEKHEDEQISTDTQKAYQQGWEKAYTYIFNVAFGEVRKVKEELDA